jgi:uncharacterized 2Fe-2S/4Fe-4S cluster protein (DUF4445 family)
MAEGHLITFTPFKVSGRVPEGTTILEAARGLGVELETACGGRQACGKCKVLIEGPPPLLSMMESGERALLRPDQEARGYRLACAARVLGDVVVSVPDQSRAVKQIIRKAATARRVDVVPVVVNYHIQLAPPGAEAAAATGPGAGARPASDLERVLEALRATYGLQGLVIDAQAARMLPAALRGAAWSATVSVRHGREIVRVDPGLVEDLLGLAVDLGTTTVAAFLCDLRTGSVVNTSSMVNPQVAFGEDVMTRIAYAGSRPGGAAELHKAAVQCVSWLAQSVTREIGLDPSDITEVVVVGNTLMHHLLLGLDPVPLGVAPFEPHMTGAVQVKARDLGIGVHPGAWVHMPPLEAAFVGSDNVAVLVSEEPDTRDEMTLVLDVGTNGELLLGSRKGVLSASCATGPAFEGAAIAHGMRAGPGAIERVRIDVSTKEPSFRVIGAEGSSGELPAEAIQAKGICGSGIIDAVAGLFETGAIDATGAFVAELVGTTPRLRKGPSGQPEYVLAWAAQTATGADITVTQADVRAIQLAKGALYAGAKVLMGKLGVSSVQSVVLAGAFGSSIDTASALTIGMFPDVDPKAIRAAGNAAGEGARMMLLNADIRRDAERRAREVGYLELALAPEFQEEFMKAMYLPHQSDAFPHLVGRLGRERANAPRWPRRGHR